MECGKVSKPYRYARKAGTVSIETFKVTEFQNLIGMLGSCIYICFEAFFLQFQNLIGMLGSCIYICFETFFFTVSKPYRYARKQDQDQDT